MIRNFSIKNIEDEALSKSRKEKPVKIISLIGFLDAQLLFFP